MSRGVDVSDTIATLATLVRLHEGNRNKEVNALLDRADECRAAVAELLEADMEFDRASENCDWSEDQASLLGRATGRRAAALAKFTKE